MGEHGVELPHAAMNRWGLIESPLWEETLEQ
jgi:hypothetical protein